MSMINISNVVSISVILPPAGLPSYSINNLVCFTKDTPLVSLGADFAAYSTAADVATDWGSSSDTYKAALAVFAQSPNILTGNGLFVVVPMVSGELLGAAITRASSLIYFGGCATTFTPGITGSTGATGANKEAFEASTVANGLGKLLFLATHLTADLTTPGLAFTIQSKTETKTRVLFHNDAAMLQPMTWAYASRGMSTNFAATNVAQTMNLKTLSGVTADTAMTQTYLNEAKAVGADVYVSIAGASCAMSYGANGFFDDVYNLMWLVGALEVAGFNHLRGTGSKIPQTETGMDGLKSAYRRVCSQATGNGFLAPGEWTGSDTFGNPEDFHRNIADFGFYIYSAPVAEQAVADRESRIAPVIQIGIKYAGALHSSSVIVQVNR